MENSEIFFKLFCVGCPVLVERSGLAPNLHEMGNKKVD